MTRELVVVSHEGSPGATVGYLVADVASRMALLVDAPRGAAKVLVEEAKRRSLHVTALVNTHGHAEQIADNPAVLAATRADLLIHPLEAHRLERPRSAGTPPMVLPMRPINEGDTIALGELILTVLHTPGHSEGSICLHVSAAGLLLSGGTLLQGGSGRTDLPGGDERAMRQSLLRLANLPPGTDVLPGQGPPTTIGAERAWIRGSPLA